MAQSREREGWGVLGHGDSFAFNTIRESLRQRAVSVPPLFYFFPSVNHTHSGMKTSRGPTSTDESSYALERDFLP